MEKSFEPFGIKQLKTPRFIKNNLSTEGFIKFGKGNGAGLCFETHYNMFIKKGFRKLISWMTKVPTRDLRVIQFLFENGTLHCQIKAGKWLIDCEQFLIIREDWLLKEIEMVPLDKMANVDPTIKPLAGKVLMREEFDIKYVLEERDIMMNRRKDDWPTSESTKSTVTSERILKKYYEMGGDIYDKQIVDLMKNK